MPSITLKAHYDGQTIRLDEPYELPPNARLLVTVIAPTQDAEWERWARLGGEGLAPIPFNGTAQCCPQRVFSVAEDDDDGRASWATCSSSA
jgi:hypothetical protein